MMTAKIHVALWSQIRAISFEKKERMKNWRWKRVEGRPVSCPWNESSWRSILDLISLNGGFCQVSEPKMMSWTPRSLLSVRSSCLWGKEEEQSEWTFDWVAPRLPSLSLNSSSAAVCYICSSLSPSCVFPISPSCVATVKTATEQIIFFPSVFWVVRHTLRLIIWATVDSKSITDGTHWCIIITLVMLMPLCFFFFLSCIWGRANGRVHQSAHVTPSVCERGHGEQKCGNVRNNKVSRDKRDVFFFIL